MSNERSEHERANDEDVTEGGEAAPVEAEVEVAQDAPEAAAPETEAPEAEAPKAEALEAEAPETEAPAPEPADPEVEALRAMVREVLADAGRAVSEQVRGRKGTKAERISGRKLLREAFQWESAEGAPLEDGLRIARMLDARVADATLRAPGDWMSCDPAELRAMWPITVRCCLDYFPTALVGEALDAMAEARLFRVESILESLQVDLDDYFSEDEGGQGGHRMTLPLVEKG